MPLRLKMVHLEFRVYAMYPVQEKKFTGNVTNICK